MVDLIPAELKKYNQWCVSTLEDKAPKLPSGNNGALYNASPTKGPWLSYGQAVKVASQINGLVGFVITNNDPFVCIDLDIKDCETVDKQTGEYITIAEYTDHKTLDNYQKIIKHFNSYTELSASGKGVHIWIKGSLPSGMKRQGIEVYPNERYIICTGHSASKVYFDMSTSLCVTEVHDNRALDVVHSQPKLDLLIGELGVPAVYTTKTSLVEIPPIHSDEVILDQARRARNNDKFDALFAGKYKHFTRPGRNGIMPKFKSQSEADYALMSMLCFYSKSNSQVRRLFRLSGLGQRKKATKDDRYLNLNLVELRSSEAAAASATVNLEIQSKALMQENRLHKIIPPKEIPPPIPPQVKESEIDWPPSLTGEIAKFIYYSSKYPVPEIAIATAFSIVAGFVGKAYNVSKTGLNLYTVIVAKSGVGKDAMFNGTNYLLARLKGGFATVSDHVDQSKYMSSSALIKGCADKSSFLNIFGEIGITLFKRLTAEGRADPQIQEMKVALLALYGQSGEGSQGLSLKYSDAANNVSGGSGIAYSILGESTPRVFYESLTEAIMADGFLSRFLVMEYNGERPLENENPITVPSKNLCEKIYSLLAQVATLTSTNQVCHVEQSPKALQISQAFNKYSGDMMYGEEDESKRQMYSRSHLKALRISAQLAVGRNKLKPVIEVEDINYALKIVKADIKRMQTKLAEGYIGSGDGPRELRILKIINDYAHTRPGHGYGINPKLYDDGLITHKYLYSRCARVSSFYNHKLGVAASFRMTVDSLINSGYIVERNKIDIERLYGHRVGRCYQILNLK